MHEHHDRLPNSIRYRNGLSHTVMVLCCIATAACGFKGPSKVEVHIPSKDDIKIPSKVDVSSADSIAELLHAIFPSLSDDDIEHFSSELTLDAVLALKVEIDDIRRVAEKLGKELSSSAAQATGSRTTVIASHNDGFPTGIEPIGAAAFYDSAQKSGRIDLSGVFRNHDPVDLLNAKVAVQVDGNAQTVTLDCLSTQPADIVFVVDITGSMSSVIGSVRRSLAAFVTAIVKKNIRGTLSVVTFQDSVGVNVNFQQRAPSSKYERSPFFKPVAIDDTQGIADLESFISRLEANSGADQPENLAGALDFARNNVIGLTSKGQPNVIGDGVEDPRDVSAWPKFQHEKQVFVAFTDAPYHSDSRIPTNSSLLAPFKPRPMATILKTLQTAGTTVHISDPSWVDGTTTPSGGAAEVSVDADYWALGTGGLGEDKIAGYSLVDLDLIVTAKDAGLLDILLDGIVGTSCSAKFALPSLSADAHFELSIELDSDKFTQSLQPIRL